MDREFGSPIERREDPALLTGREEYVDDIPVEDAAYVAVLGSQYGHARIEGIDTRPAEDHPDTIAVFTADDIDESGVPGTIPGQASMSQYDRPEAASTVRRELVTPHRSLLARDRVRYQGDPIAVVVAENRYAANNAVDRIDVEYDPLDAATDPAAARAEGAPTIHDAAPDNVAYETEIGDEAAVEEAFDRADLTVSVDLDHQRVNPTPMEPRAMIAEYDGESLDVTMTTQTPHFHREMFSTALGVPESDIRVRAPAVGGGFGAKMNAYPREAIVAWCATRFDRPVRWQATRYEEFLTDGHGRAHETEAELALDGEEFLALRTHSYTDLGAYVSSRGPRVLTTPFTAMLSGQYAIPSIYARITGMFTNAAPTGPYRGTSRTRAILILERLVDLAARELGTDPAELRRKNFIGEFPYTSPIGTYYDSGDYDRALDTALDRIDYEELRAEQARAREHGRYVGIGFGCGIDEGGSNSGEAGRVRIGDDGSVTAYCGTADQGQGHRTAFTQVVADRLGVPSSEIELVEGDTDAVPEGTGTFGSRSAFQGGTALRNAAESVVDRARELAAEEFEVDTADLVFEDGAFHVTGVPDRALTIGEVAARTDEGIEASTWYDPENVTMPSSTHVAVVEIDPERPEIDLRRYVAVDDVGTQINPRIVEGQVHGGVVQGIGQAMYESVEYGEGGSMVSAAFTEYAMPRAENVPEIEADSIETPSPVTPLGVKGVGESGTIAAPAAIANAVADALAPFDVEHLDLPITPERVWRAVRESDGE